jgi:hypothetical protein
MTTSTFAETQAKVDRIARVMDDWIRVPGTRIGIGWDAILGFIPGIGDAITLLPQILLIAQALRVGIRKRALAMMLLNTLVDFLVGAVPVVGDLLDILWKSNRRNADLLRSEIARAVSR